jgi:menaquinone-dependent protoporphyrinogen oxidase
VAIASNPRDGASALAVFYATREGQTRRIAEHLASALRDRGCAVDVMNVDGGLPPGLDVSRYAGAVVAASIHTGRHQRAMVEFVRKHRAALQALPTTFLSVSLSQAGVEDANASPERKARAAAEVRKTIDRFLRTTGWQPTRVHPVAGALLYRQYAPWLRLVMRFISGMAGASTDTTRDHEYTDWQAVSRFAGELADRAGRVSAHVG